MPLSSAVASAEIVPELLMFSSVPEASLMAIADRELTVVSVVEAAAEIVPLLVIKGSVDVFPT